MIIGVPKEIKTRENRVGLVPGGVAILSKAGHEVLMEAGAGQGVGIVDSAYKEAGAKIITSADEVWKSAEMIIKVKEPVPAEYERMQSGQVLYTYLHLAADKPLTDALLKKKVTSIAYETMEAPDGSLPLLKPMSEVAGRMAVQVGAHCLEKHIGGKGLLLGGVPGVRRGRVAIIGGGVVGLNSIKIAVGLGAQVTVLDVDAARLAWLDDIFGTAITTLMSNPESIAQCAAEADLLVGAVLVTGAKAPTLVTRGMVKAMEPGSAIVDVSIDQGGAIETIRATTHDDPVYVDEGVIHYGVTNIPGAVPMTSTYALTNVTLPYAVQIANQGIASALEQSLMIRTGLNTHDGRLMHSAVGTALQMPHESYQS
ncbi:MAG: alanine dehydrogenase [Oligoflexales bacterium]